jgi:hypothetical protein
MRILGQSLRANASPSWRPTGRLRDISHQGGTPARVGWTSRPLIPFVTHFTPNTRSRRGRVAWAHAVGESESFSLMR